jgi:hypothetical protein
MDLSFVSTEDYEQYFDTLTSYPCGNIGNLWSLSGGDMMLSNKFPDLLDMAGKPHESTMLMPITLSCYGDGE